MALTATVYNFDIDLADGDRHRYESLALRVARHPSESEEYLVARVLAYCLEYQDGIAFSSGISNPEDPALAVRDLTGAIKVWVEIGSPAADRLHKASKAAGRVAVYTHKDPAQVLRQLAGERIHRAADIDFYSLDRTLVAGLVARLERRMSFAISVNDRHLTISTADSMLEGTLTRHQLGAS